MLHTLVALEKNALEILKTKCYFSPYERRGSTNYIPDHYQSGHCTRKCQFLRTVHDIAMHRFSLMICSTSLHVLLGILLPPGVLSVPLHDSVLLQS
jgi:hypothetical protein